MLREKFIVCSLAREPTTMQLLLASEENDQNVTELETSSEISQKYLTPEVDLLKGLLGDDVYQQKVMLDLSQSPFVDSSGVGWLIQCHKEFKAHGGKFVIHSVPPRLMQVFRLLKMEKVLHFADNRAQALKMLEDEGGQHE